MVDVGQRVTLRARLRVHRPVDTPGFWVPHQGPARPVSLRHQHTTICDQPLEQLVAGEVITYSFEFNAALGPGNYSISTAPVSTSDHLTNNYEWRDLALLFTVVNMTQPYFEGLSWLPPKLEIDRP